MKNFRKRGLFLLGLVFASTAFIGNVATGYLDFSSSGSSSVNQFDFRYGGIVNTGNEVMPLVGQLSKDGNRLFFTSQNMRGNKQLYVMNRNSASGSFDKPTRLKGVGNDEGYDIIMPTVNADESVMIFVSSVDGTQRGNDLFEATTADGGLVNIRPL